MIANILARLAPAQPLRIKTAPQNRPYNVAIEPDYTIQIAYICLQQLILKDYQLIKANPPARYTPFDCTAPELLQLQALLPGRDPHRPRPDDSAQLVLNPAQVRLLRKYLSKELRWLTLYQTSRLEGVSADAMQRSFLALKEALFGCTKLLTWSELCATQSRW